jgi:hypothetical protein
MTVDTLPGPSATVGPVPPRPTIPEEPAPANRPASTPGHHASADEASASPPLPPRPKRLGGITGKGFRPGKSGNPGGQPRGLVTEIRHQTKDGHELVTFALRVLRNEKAEMRDRCWACTYLTDRGFGKPVQAIEHAGPDGERLFQPAELRALTDDQLAKLRTFLREFHAEISGNGDTSA